MEENDLIPGGSLYPLRGPALLPPGGTALQGHPSSK